MTDTLNRGTDAAGHGVSRLGPAGVRFECPYRRSVYLPRSSLTIMTNSNAPKTRGSSPVIWGAILLVAGIVLAFVGFSDTGIFLGIAGCVLTVFGAVAVLAGLRQRTIR